MTEVGERWTIRFVRAAAIVMLLMEAAYMAIDLVWYGQKTALVVTLHLLLIADVAALVFLVGASALIRFWPQFVLVTACLMFTLTTMLARSTGQIEPVVITVTICALGAAALVPWNTLWQVALTVAGATAIGAGPPQPIYHWLLSITAFGVAFCATLLGERHRAARDAQSDAIMRSHRALVAETAERERIVGEREQALARLSENEAKLRQIFEASLDTIAISRLSDGRFIECNRSFLAISGYTRDEAIGRSAKELGVWANRGELREYMRRLRTDGRVPQMEMTLRSKDGRLIPHLATAVVARIGDEPCIITIGHEITDLKRTESELRRAREELSRQVAALRETETRLRREISDREAAQSRLQESETTLRNVADASVDAIALTDFGSGRLMRMNRSFAKITGYSPTEALGRTPGELKIWADRDQQREFVQLLLRDGEVRDFEGLLRHRDGRVTPYLMSAAVADVNGELRVITIAHDISERKRVERELIAAREAALAASHAKSEFLSSMSHEIRTPMNAILGMADLLAETPLNDEQRRFLDAMRDNGDALLELINGVLDLAKIESGRVSLERVPFDPGEAVEKVLETLALRAHEKGLELIGRVSHAPAFAIGDALRLRQVLVNLVGNAIKFTARGEVEVTAEPVAADAPGRWRFSVRDTGIGIAPAQLDAIFSAFTQGDSSTARRFGGSGLGLAIVKRLVELMRGSISVTSTLGEGSEFVCEIPFELDERAGSEPPAGVRPGRLLCGGRWLVADDHPRQRAALAGRVVDCGAATVDSIATCEALAAISRAAGGNAPYAGVVFGRAPRAGASPPLSGLIREIRALGAAAPGIVAALATDSMRTDLAELGKIGFSPEMRCAWVVKPAKRREFAIALACAAGRAIAPPDRSVQSAPAAPGMDAEQATNLRPLKILLTDDSADNRILVRAFLKALPYEIDTAENGAVAIEAVKRANYDVILMDIQMPVVDGIEATRTIRAWERENGRKRTPIIALTASALDDAVRRSRDAGCDGHVSKPVKRATLIAAIRAAADLGVSAKSSTGTASASQMEPAMQEGKRTIVEIDADLRDLAPAFIDRKRADAARLRSAIEGADFAVIAAIAHKIKGEGGSYGFDELTRIGGAIETAALSGGAEETRREVSRLADYLDSVEIVFR